MKYANDVLNRYHNPDIIKQLPFSLNSSMANCPFPTSAFSRIISSMPISCSEFMAISTLKKKCVFVETCLISLSPHKKVCYIYSIDALPYKILVMCLILNRNYLGIGSTVTYLGQFCIKHSPVIKEIKSRSTASALLSVHPNSQQISVLDKH